MRGRPRGKILRAGRLPSACLRAVDRSSGAGCCCRSRCRESRGFRSPARCAYRYRRRAGRTRTGLAHQKGVVWRCRTAFHWVLPHWLEHGERKSSLERGLAMNLQVSSAQCSGQARRTTKRISWLSLSVAPWLAERDLPRRTAAQWLRSCAKRSCFQKIAMRLRESRHGSAGLATNLCSGSREIPRRRYSDCARLLLVPLLARMQGRQIETVLEWEPARLRSSVPACDSRETFHRSCFNRGEATSSRFPVNRNKRQEDPGRRQ